MLKTSRRWICGPSFSPDSLRLRCPAAYGPRTFEDWLLLGTVGYTALFCAHLSSVPSGDRSANPASVCVSSERFSQLFPPVKPSRAERLAAPLGVPRAAGLVSCQSSASGHRASSSRHTRGQFWETGYLSRGFMRFALVAKHTIIIFTLTASVVGLLTAESFWGLHLLELRWDSLWVVGPRWASLKNPCVWSIVGIPSI